MAGRQFDKKARGYQLPFQGFQDQRLGDAGPQVHARRAFRGIFRQRIDRLINDFYVDFWHGAKIQRYAFTSKTVA